MKRFLNSPKNPKGSPSSKLFKQTATDATFGFGQRKPIDESGFKDFLVKIKESKLRYASSVQDCDFPMKRVRLVNGVEPEGEINGVVYWTTRDQRVDDNWGLLYAQKLALEHKCPLYYVFCLVPKFSEATIRQFDFLLKGMQQNEAQCRSLQINFNLLIGYAKDVLPEFVKDRDIDMVVTDFWPLREPLGWLNETGKRLAKLNASIYQCDSHNIVPCWVASPKLEFGARTIRPKIHNNLKEFLTEIPPVIKHPYVADKPPIESDWEGAYESLDVDCDVPPVTWAQPGTINGYRMLYEFITQRLKNFEADRNDPTRLGLSCLSPWYHFGQLSVHRAILCITEKSIKSKAQKSVDAYIEEAVVRRELSDNYCYYQPDYDNFNGAWDWAKKSLNEHRKDKREFIYSSEDLELGRTHDQLWNAAQIQLMKEGKMHGFLRMYWAKKILEWTTSAEEALEMSMYLNDKYELDGRDPSGYVGCMWSIVGVHDRAWTERPVFGKIRYMNFNGCVRKFDVKSFITRYPSL